MEAPGIISDEGWYAIRHVEVEDAEALCEYCSAIGRETEYTTIEPTGFWMTPDDERKFIEDLKKSGTHGGKGFMIVAEV